MDEVNDSHTKIFIHEFNLISNGDEQILFLIKNFKMHASNLYQQKKMFKLNN